MIAVGSDGAAVNTGWKNGAIKKIEDRIERPLQRIICQLHMNELPLKAAITKMDGPTTGLKAYSGQIGKKLNACETMNIVPFHSMPFDFKENITDAFRASLSNEKYQRAMAKKTARTQFC